MALADRVTNPPPPSKHGTPCSIGALLKRLEGPELDALKHMLGSPEAPGWPASAIFEALTDEGHEVGYQQINKHRGRKCRCAKGAA